MLSPSRPQQAGVSLLSILMRVISFPVSALQDLGLAIDNLRHIMHVNSQWLSFGDCKQCDLLVDLYTPHMIEQLDNLTPQEFCEKMKLCKPPQLSWKRNDCALCQFVILEIKLKLQDPNLQVCVLNNSVNPTFSQRDACLVINYCASFSCLCKTVACCVL